MIVGHKAENGALRALDHGTDPLRHIPRREVLTGHLVEAHPARALVLQHSARRELECPWQRIGAWVGACERTMLGCVHRVCRSAG